MTLPLQDRSRLVQMVKWRKPLLPLKQIRMRVRLRLRHLNQLMILQQYSPPQELPQIPNLLQLQNM